MTNTIIALLSGIGLSGILFGLGSYIKYKGKQQGREEEKNKQREATIDRIESNRDVVDSVDGLSSEELKAMWGKDKRLQEDE